MSETELKFLDNGKMISIEDAKLEECIEYINRENLSGVHICDLMYRSPDISFLRRCPNIEGVCLNSRFVDSIGVLTELEFLEELTISETKLRIDLTQFKHLKRLSCGYKEVDNLEQVKSLDSLNLMGYKPKEKNFKELSEMDFAPTLKRLSMAPSPVTSLAGIEKFSQLTEIDFAYFTKLTDLTGIEKLSETLQSLRLDDSKKMKDVSVFSALKELRRVALCDDGDIESIAFVKELKHLESLIFMKTNVLDGDMSYCKGIKHVNFTNKKHYTHRSKEFNKNIE